jgi:hypothetical protein
MGTDARSIKVSFYPVAEQYGYAAEKIQNKKGTSLGKWFGYVIGYVVIHIFLVPLILFLFGQYLLAGISIGISGIFFAAYSKFGKTNAYVEFYPSLEDYVYIAHRLSSSVPTGTLSLYSFYAFLFLNTIVFPVFLWSANIYWQVL